MNLIRSGTVFDDFSTVSNWVKQSAGGTIAEETTIVRHGSASLKMTAASASNCFADKTGSFDFSTDTTFSFWVYIDGASEISTIAVYISSQTNYSSFFFATVSGSAMRDGWNRVTLSRGDFSNTGSESWSNTMQKVRLRINASSGTPTVYWDEMKVGEIARPKILFTFDDSWDSQYSKAYSYMKTKGIRGTIYVIGERINTSGYMTENQAQEVFNAGWDLCVHGDTNLTTLGTVAEQQAEISLNQEWLRGKNLVRNNSDLQYANPNGGYNSNSDIALKNLNFETARTIIDGTQDNYIDSPYRIIRRAVYNTTTRNQVQGWINECIARGSSLWLNYHIIVDSTADVSTKVLTADFQDDVDYAVSKQAQADIVTVTEWLSYVKGQRTNTPENASKIVNNYNISDQVNTAYALGPFSGEAVIKNGELGFSALGTGTEFGWMKNCIFTNYDKYTDFDLYATVRKGSENLQISFRTGTGYGGGYGMQLRDGNTHRLEIWQASTVTGLNHGSGWVTGELYNIRLSVVGEEFKYKYWQGDTEPSTWLIEYSGLTNFSEGKIGFHTENGIEGTLVSLKVFPKGVRLPVNNTFGKRILVADA